MELKAETLERIDKLIPRYPEKRSLVLPLLHIIQEERGYICDSSMEWIAEKLDIQPMAVLEVLTFYPMFRRKAIGKIHVKVLQDASLRVKRSLLPLRETAGKTWLQAGRNV